jgi:hypothetical protein
VQRIAAVDGGFQLDDLGRFRHVLIATGHPGLSLPPELHEEPREGAMILGASRPQCHKKKAARLPKKGAGPRVF